MGYEQMVINQLRGYKRLVARMKFLEKYSIGAGIQVSTLAEDDRLQELHRKLRGLPSYLYLTRHEQDLETTAHAYLPRYPVGIKAQFSEVQQLRGTDPEDEKRLRELQRKIKKVLETRLGDIEGFEAVIERVSELQDLQLEKIQIDNALEALAEYKSQYSKLLRLRYIEGKPAEQVAFELGITDRTFRRWQQEAISEIVRFMSA